LSPEAIATVFQGLGVSLPAGISVKKATGGNPLFVVELARELANRPDLPDQLPVPPSLADLIQQRLSQLPAYGRQVLESIAVLDRPARFDLIRQISARSEDETLQAVELGLRWRLLQTSDSPQVAVKMAHDLMQQAVREQMSAVRRQILHRRTAQVLAQHNASPATLCYHWHHAGNQEEEAHFAVLAAETAVSVHAYHEAITYLQRVLSLTSDPGKKADLLLQLGRAQALLGEWEQAEQAFQAGLRLLDEVDGRLQAELQRDYGRLLEQKGNYAAAIAEDEAALAYFTQVDDRSEIAQLRGHLGLLAWRQSNYESALDHYHAGLTDAEAMRDPQTRVILHNGLGLVQWRLQQHDEALAHFQVAYETAVTQQDLISQAQVQCNTGNVHAAMSQFDVAITHYRQACDIANTIQYKAVAVLAVGNLGLMYFYKGDDEQALNHCQQALAASREMGNKSQIAHQLSNIANIYFRQDRIAEAFDYCQQSFALNTELNDRRGMLIDAGNMGHLYLLWGETEAALICLHYALQLDEQLEHPVELARHLSNLADVYLLLGELTEAERLCRQAITLQTQHNNPFELAWTLWLYGRLQWTQNQPHRARETLHQSHDLAAANARADLVADIDRTLAALQNGDDPIAYGRTLLKPNLPPAPEIFPRIAQTEVELPPLWQKITVYIS
jgi:tetratricopeptide (TPR) repeat protein